MREEMEKITLEKIQKELESLRKKYLSMKHYKQKKK
jgi:hypothetical protein